MVLHQGFEIATARDIVRCCRCSVHVPRAQPFGSASKFVLSNSRKYTFYVYILIIQPLGGGLTFDSSKPCEFGANSSCLGKTPLSAK